MLEEAKSQKMLLTLRCQDTSINLAIKALAIFDHKLEDKDEELYCLVDYAGFKNKLLRSCTIHSWILDERKEYSMQQEVLINKDSVPHNVGRFIASTFIQQKKLQNMCVRACGDIPISIAVQAIFCARHNLKEENLDLVMMPRFSSDTEFTLVNLFLSCFAVN